MSEEAIEECYKAPTDPPYHFHIVGNGGCATSEEKYPKTFHPQNQTATDPSHCAKLCFERPECGFFDWGWPTATDLCNLFNASIEIVKGNSYPRATCYRLQKM